MSTVVSEPQAEELDRGAVVIPALSELSGLMDAVLREPGDHSSRVWRMAELAVSEGIAAEQVDGVRASVLAGPLGTRRSLPDYEQLSTLSSMREVFPSEARAYPSHIDLSRCLTAVRVVKSANGALPRTLAGAMNAASYLAAAAEHVRDAGWDKTFHKPNVRSAPIRLDYPRLKQAILGHLQAPNGRPKVLAMLAEFGLLARSEEDIARLDEERAVLTA